MCADVVAANYHSWGFMSTSLGPCRPLFQELLLLLQPLSVLPFDLNLLLEPRLLLSRQLCSHQDASPPPCSALLVTSWPQLQADKKAARNHAGQPASQQGVTPHQGSPAPQCEEAKSKRSPRLAAIPEWERMQDEEDCSCSKADGWSQISVCSRQEEQRGGRSTESLRPSTWVRPESPHQGALRWASLFGVADPSPRTETVPHRDPGAQSRR